VFFWDLLQKRDEMPSADARVCAEMREALHIWDLAKGIEQANPEIWNDELILLRQDFFLDRNICIDNHPTILRYICIIFKYQSCLKKLMEY